VLSYSRLPANRSQRGISLLEMIGALTALAVGIGLGLVFLRERLEQSPASAQPITAAEDQLDELAAEELGYDKDLQQKIQTLQAELASLQQKDQPTGSAAQEPADKQAENQSTAETATPPDSNSKELSREEIRKIVGRRTLKYWNGLNRIMANEEQMRRAPAGQLTRHNTGDFMKRRGEAHRYAASAIRDLPTKAIDLEAVHLASDIAAWYEQAAEINDQGIYLFQRGTVEQRKGPLGRAWSESERKHNAGVAAINARGDRLRAKLSEKYGLSFPDLR